MLRLNSFLTGCVLVGGTWLFVEGLVMSGVLCMVISSVLYIIGDT